MKKVYLGIFTIFGTMFAFGQQYSPISNKHAIFATEKAGKQINYSAKSIIWSDDFSTPSNWTFSNTSTPSLNWSIETNPDLSPVAALRPLGFTTVSNGFAFIDSDAAGGTATQNANIRTANAIDLTGYPDVSLQFENAYRVFQDTRIVRVSGDNGATWTEYYITGGSTGVPSNTNSNNPSIVSLNISAVAGGQSQVLVEFNYQGAWGWFWAVDDVKIVETDDYDLEAKGVYWGVEGPWGPRLTYGITPVSQISEIKFGGIVSNIGLNTINDVTFSTSIPSASYSESVVGTLAISTVDTFDITTAFTPAAVPATHTVSYTVETPGNTENNVTNNIFPNTTLEVSNHIYARDLNQVVGGLTNQGQPYEIGAIYDIYQTAELTGITVHVNSSSVAGAQIYGKLYSIGGSDFTYIDETDSYTLTSSDIGEFVTLPFSFGSQTLDADTPYLIVVGTYGSGGANNDLIVSSSGNSEGGNKQSVYFFDGTDNTWYYMTSVPMVRMNFEPSTVSVDNVSLEGVKVYPNPSTGVVNVTNDLNVENTIVVTDITGKIVSSQVSSTATTIDLTTAGTGIYLVEVANQNGKKVERVVIK